MYLITCTYLCYHFMTNDKLSKIIFLADGNWGSWETWQDCSVTCGKGYNVRVRQCNDPPPMNGGQPCSGQSAQQRECNEGDCQTSKGI